MTQKELLSKENFIKTMEETGEAIFTKWDKNFDLGLIKQIELLEKKNKWFNELNTRKFEVWKYHQLKNLRDFEKALFGYTSFMKKGKMNYIIEAINTVPLPQKKQNLKKQEALKKEFKKIEICHKEVYKLCEKSYESLVSNCLLIPKLKFFDKKFPVKEKDEQPDIDE